MLCLYSVVWYKKVYKHWWRCICTHSSMILLTLHLREGYCKWLGKCLPVCVTLLYFKNWTLLDFHTWRVYTPPKWQERVLTNIFSTILEAIEKGKKSARCGFFQFLHLTKHEFYITGCLNDSSFQQSKLESLNMYTLKVKADKSFTKHPTHNYSIN